MEIYLFSSKTNELIGSKESGYDPKNPDRYLVPKNATDIKPPEVCENEVAVMDCGDMPGVGDSRINPNAEWVIKPDYRGGVYWTEDREKIEINEIGVEPKENWLEEKPPKTEKEIEIENLEQEVSQLISDVENLRDALHRLQDFDASQSEIDNCKQELLDTKALLDQKREELKNV